MKNIILMIGVLTIILFSGCLTKTVVQVDKKDIPVKKNILNKQVSKPLTTPNDTREKKLAKFKKLHEDGLISDEEYAIFGSVYNNNKIK